MASDPVPSPPVDRWFDGDGIRIHGLDWSGPDSPTGAPVLFLHGIGGNAWIWDDVAQHLRSTLPHRQLVAIDGRDGGDTDHPADGYDRERFVADILAVLGALGGRPAVLVGHSRSGWLGAWLASQHPDRVERLVMVDPARLEFASAEASDQYYAAIAEALGPFDDEAAALAWARAHDGDAQFTPGRIRSLLFGYRRRPDGRLIGKLPAEAVPNLQAARADAASVIEALTRITCPSLLIVGTAQSEARIAQRMAYANLIPTVDVVRIAATHFVHADAPAEVAAAIRAFVGDQPGSTNDPEPASAVTRPSS